MTLRALATLSFFTVGLVGLVGQTTPVTQTVFSGQTTAATAAVPARGQASHALTVVFSSATTVSDFVLRVEGSFDGGGTWLPISADLTSATSNGTAAAATVRANGVFPRIRVNLATASARPLSAYYVGTATPVIEGFVFGGGTGGGSSAPLTMSAIVSALGFTPQNAAAGASSCTYRGYWDSAVSYPPSPDTCSTVLYGAAPSSMFQSIATSSNVIPGTDATKWQQVGYIVPQRYRGVYASGTTYVPLDIVSNAGSSYISLTTSTGQTPPDPFFFPAGNAYWGIIASGSATTATPTLTTSVSPTARTLIQGTSTTFAVTYTAVALSSAIVPTVTGIPSGVTVTWNPTTVASTGGSTTATLTATSTAALMSSSLVFGGTAGAVTGTSFFATLVTDTPAQVLSNISSSLPAVTITSPYAIPSVGVLDWKAATGSPNEHHLGTSVISDLQGVAFGGCGDLGPYYFSGGVTQTWTNGALATSGSSNVGGNPGIGGGTACALRMGVGIPDAAAHAVRLTYFLSQTGSSDGVTVTFTDASASSTPLVIEDTTASDAVRQITVRVRGTAASTLTVDLHQHGANAVYKALELIN